MSAPRPITDSDRGLAGWLARGFGLVASLALFFLMCLTCVDVVARYGFNRPVTGSTELTEIAVAVVVFSCLPVVTWRNEHIVVDLFDRFFSPRWHTARLIVIHLVCVAALGFLGQRVAVLAARALDHGELSEYLAIPVGYVIGFIAAMCWVTAALVLLFGITRVVQSRASGG